MTEPQARLSLPIDRLRPHYPVVVIGSGYGGAIAASRLSRCGQQVCLLECGREFQPGEYPRTQLQAVAQMQATFPRTAGLSRIGPRTGLYEFNVNADINVAKGCGLGGTSLINANVILPPRGEIFTGSCWPAALRMASAGDGPPPSLMAGVQRALEMLRPAPYPDHFPALLKLRALEESAKRIGATCYRPPLAVSFADPPGCRNHIGVEQHACVLCGDCVSGCNYGAKNTVLMNYLPDARNHGAEIFTQVAVERISREDGHWQVHCRLLDGDPPEGREPVRVLGADIVILAAGALGSPEILLRSRRAGLPLSDKLGHRFTGNGDVLAFGYNTEHEINGVGFGDHRVGDLKPVGPCITGIIDSRGDRPLPEAVVVEEGAIPGPLAFILPNGLYSAFLLDWSIGRPLHELADEIGRKVESLFGGAYRGAVHNTQTYLGMAIDDDQGQLYLDEDDHVRIAWSRAGSEPIFSRVHAVIKEVTESLGGAFVRDPVFTRHQRRGLVTVHPLGGCVMADEAADGVVNHKGQVFSGRRGDAVHDGLYVWDGAMVPAPVGVNPLLTISGLVERACTLLAQERGWSLDYSLAGDRPNEAMMRPP